MKRFLIVVALTAISCFVFSEVDPRINSYNESFEKKDYEKALNNAESIIASFPEVLDFHREKAKMLAATNQKEKFVEEMLLIRNSQNPGSVQCFFAALSHDLVSKEFRDDLRRLFFQRNDTEILLSWPQFSTDKEMVVSKVYGVEEHSNEDVSQISHQQPVDSEFSQTGSSNQSSSTDVYQTMEIDDLRVDFEILKGKKVKVTARANYLGNILVISRDVYDTSNVTVDMKNISREQRKYVIQNCSEGSGKSLTIYGSIGVVDFANCLIADKIEW